jgi:glycerophosphoryl diester phosphodiesterase
MAETKKENRTTKVWAHRGASGYRPENTMEAFELAIKQGADGIELDVHTSADGELIVMHDETVDRVTDKTGLIKDMTLAQLKELKVSTDVEPNGIYRVPTLVEVLDLMRTTYDGKYRIKKQHLLLSRNGREDIETGKRNAHGRSADLLLIQPLQSDAVKTIG